MSDNGADELGIGLRRVDGHAWKYGATFVGHAAVQLRRRLSEGHPADQKKTERDTRGTIQRAGHGTPSSHHRRPRDRLNDPSRACRYSIPLFVTFTESTPSRKRHAHRPSSSPVDVLDLVGRNRQVVAVEHDEIGQLSRLDRSEVVFLQDGTRSGACVQ